MILYLFDIDGTLLHAHGSGRDAFTAVFAEAHGIADACAGVRFGGKTDPAIIDEIYLARLGRPASGDERAAFLSAYLPRLEAALASHGVEVLPGAHDALAYLASRGDVVLGVATGNVIEGAAAKLAHGGFADRFVLGGYGSDSHLRPALVAAAIARARARSDIREVVVVGDTIHDISAARACGAIACAVSTGSDTADALAHADTVLASLADLPAWHASRYGDNVPA
ncbi:MAG TPA: HAD family hydrolase [Kofleriaceae bacterium]